MLVVELVPAELVPELVPGEAVEIAEAADKAAALQAGVVLGGANRIVDAYDGGLANAASQRLGA